ncbi:MAG: S-methyl-5-thioribose-1-phosphate isomerase [Planctomycetota bacterium]|nr:S-methyl-5-thioribose-1-phosphate isomerase [Planctomycetota bacterium]
MMALPPTIAWSGTARDGHLELLDQTCLPQRVEVLRIGDVESLVAAIRRLSVRGAPAIGVAAAYGVVLGVRDAANGDAFHELLRSAGDALIAARPTAVNLPWAVRRMQAAGTHAASLDALLDEARAIHEEDRALCRAMGEAGAPLVREGATVLTHCNTGRLATAGDGTALAVLFEAWRRGTRFRVLADETRPLLQGARLTALELAAEGIPVDVIADGAAAGLIARGEVDLVLVGADRVAGNGDAANKVGTYGLALACHAHGVPMYVVAPTTTFDLGLEDGSMIPIEERDPAEVLTLGGSGIEIPEVGARNPAFDVTPGCLLAGIVTDRGIIRPVDADAVRSMIGG